MKNRYTLAFFLILIVFASCEDNDFSKPEKCKEIIEYYEGGELVDKEESEYRDGLMLRKECMNGNVYEYEYDYRGNQTLKRIYYSDGDIWEDKKKYDLSNNLIRIDEYRNGALYISKVRKYEGNLIQRSFQVWPSSDTNYVVTYYYDEDVLIRKNDSYSDTYYYYSELTDSIIEKEKDGTIIYRQVDDIVNRQVIHREAYWWENSKPRRYRIKDFEYSGDKLISERTTHWSSNTPVEWTYEHKYIYENDILMRYEWVVDDILSKYDIYTYDSEDILERVEKFDSTHNSLSYNLYFGSCTSNLD